MENIVKSTLGFEINNLHPQLATIYPLNTEVAYLGFKPTTNYLVLDFGKKRKGDLASIQLIITDIDITGASASCGCTTPTVQKTEKGDNLVTITFNSSLIIEGNPESKWVTLLVDKGLQEIKINLIINKK